MKELDVLKVKAQLLPKCRDIQMGFLINVMRKLVQVKMLKILFMNIQKRMLMLFMKKEKCQLNLLFFIFV